MGISLYIRNKGESIEEAFERDTGEWFGYKTKTMSELGAFGTLAGVPSLFGFVGEAWISPERAAENAAKLRTFLSEVKPGPKGSTTDEEMCGLAAELASFLEWAADQNGYVVW